MTTIRAAGLSEQDSDVRRFGMSKEGVIARQIMLGVVQTVEGLPLYHEVFDGNMAEVNALKPTLEKIVMRFPVKRVIAVADRGLLSTDNLADLQTITLLGDGKLEFILAVPGRRYSEFVELLGPLHAEQFAQARQELLGESTWNGSRLIVAHDPQVAAEAGTKRDRLIQVLEPGSFRSSSSKSPSGRASSTSKMPANAAVAASAPTAALALASITRRATPTWRASCGWISRASCSATALTRRRWRTPG